MRPTVQEDVLPLSDSSSPKGSQWVSLEKNSSIFTDYGNVMRNQLCLQENCVPWQASASLIVSWYIFTDTSAEGLSEAQAAPLFISEDRVDAFWLSSGMSPNDDLLGCQLRYFRHLSKHATRVGINLDHNEVTSNYILECWDKTAPKLLGHTRYYHLLSKFTTSMHIQGNGDFNLQICWFRIISLSVGYWARLWFQNK